MAVQLLDIYRGINGRRTKGITQIPTDQILFTQSEKDVDNNIFSCFFESSGGNGFGRHFFNQNQKNLSTGAK